MRFFLAPPPENAEVDAALLRMGYARMHQTVLMTLGICLSFYYIFRPLFPMPQGHYWLAGLVGVASLRYILWWRYDVVSRRPAGQSVGFPWKSLYFLAAILAGSSWSLGALLLFEAGSHYEILLIQAMVVLAVSAVAASSLSAQFWAMQGFLVSALGPLVWIFLNTARDSANITAGIISAGLLLLLISGRESGKATRVLIETRLKLSQAMTDAQASLAHSELASQHIRELNEQLEHRVNERTRELQAKDVELRDAMSLNEEIFTASPAGIAVYRQDGQCIMGNPVFAQTVNATMEVVLSDNFLKRPAWRKTGGRRVALRVLETGTSENIHIQTTTSSGRELWLYCHFTRITHRGVPHLLVMIQDTTLHKLAEEEVRKLAFFDHLTSLPNRRLLTDRLQQACLAAKRHDRHGALILLDMDNFKALNDTLGHEVGDRFLIEVAERLRSCLRAEDTLARQGGDEFMIILEGLDAGLVAASQVESIAVKILQAVSQPYQLDLPPLADTTGRRNYSYHCTSSIGIALFHDDSASAEELIKRADTAMYQAKSAGRNAMRFFDPEMQARISAHAVLENDLREAVRRNEFVLHYQPQADAEGRITGAEVLARWQHPARGMVPPNDFIPLAEMNGLILPIGQWVLETACQQLQKWAGQAEFATMTLAVNVSARQFLHADYVSQVEATLEHYDIQPGRLKLELTESLLAHDVDDIVAKMNALQQRGISFSLDDFGTGYSSLSYLKRLPLDQLKIDQSFVRDVLVDPNDATIARTIVALGQSMGLNVIAEGVETREQREFLAANGCHLYQGYFFGKPAPIEAFERDYLTRRSPLDEVIMA